MIEVHLIRDPHLTINLLVIGLVCKHYCEQLSGSLCAMLKLKQRCEFSIIDGQVRQHGQSSKDWSVQFLDHSCTCQCIISNWIRKMNTLNWKVRIVWLPSKHDYVQARYHHHCNCFINIIVLHTLILTLVGTFSFQIQYHMGCGFIAPTPCLFSKLLLNCLFLFSMAMIKFQSPCNSRPRSLTYHKQAVGWPRSSDDQHTRKFDWIFVSPH
jgi:hypothetical protein